MTYLTSQAEAFAARRAVSSPTLVVIVVDVVVHAVRLRIADCLTLLLMLSLLMFLLMLLIMLLMFMDVPDWSG